MKRALSMILALALILTLAPVTARAWEQVQYTNFEDLKALFADGTFDGMVEYYENGSIVIGEDLTIPEEASLFAPSAELIVNEGVTLTIDGSVTCNMLVNNGTIDNRGSAAYNGVHGIQGSGTIINAPRAWMEEIYQTNSADELVSLAQKAALETDRKVRYQVQVFPNYEESSAMVLPADVTIPDRMFVAFHGVDLVIPAGVTLKAAENVSVQCSYNGQSFIGSLTVDGTFEAAHNCNVYIDVPVTVTGNFRNHGFIQLVKAPDYIPAVNIGGKIDVTAGGTYEGYGDVTVYKYAGTELAEYLPGIDLEYFTEVTDRTDRWELEKDQPRSVEVTSFEEIKEIASQSWKESVTLYYKGEGPLVISESLDLSGLFRLDSTDTFYGELVIPEGVTFEIDQVNFGVITVNGTVINRDDFHAVTSLTVNGTVRNHDTVRIHRNATISGLDKIISENENATVLREFYIYKFADIGESLAIMESEKALGLDYSMEFNNWYAEGDGIVISESVTIPENVYVRLDSAGSKPTTIAEGCTLTLNGRTDIYHKLIVNGELVNNGVVTVRPSIGGLISVGGTGSISRMGQCHVVNNLDGGAAAGFENFDLSGCSVREEYFWSDVYNSYERTWLITEGGEDPVEPPTVPVPTEPEVELGEGEFATFEQLKALLADESENRLTYVGAGTLVISENTAIPSHMTLDVPGALVVSEGVTLTVEGSVTGSDIRVDGKLVNNGTVRSETQLRVSGSFENNWYLQVQGDDYPFIGGPITHGADSVVIRAYNFGVDENSLRELLQGAAWEQEPQVRYEITMGGDPGEQLLLGEDLTIPANVDLYLNGVNLYATDKAAMTVEGFLWASRHQDDPEMGKIVVHGSMIVKEGAELRLSELLFVNGTLENNGTVTLSNFIPTQAAEVKYGGILEMNVGCKYQGLGSIAVIKYDENAALETYLPGVDLSYFTDIRDEGNRWTLTKELQLDVNEFSTYEQLKALLNSSHFVISYVANEYMDNELVIQEDLTLDKVVSVEEGRLVIPEGVTLTVNNRLDVEELQLDGTLINNGILWVKGGLMGDGTLTNNGDMTLPEPEQPDYSVGDVNGDGAVTADDAIHLLYYTLFGEGMYPVNQNCDYNGDGAVNADDAIYLLYFTLFGDSLYPLHSA